MFNPELSIIQNMMLDLEDFRERVRPACRDIAIHEQTMKYQPESAADLRRDEKEFQDLLKKA